MSANDYQVGGSHYRKTPGEQHWDRLVRLYGLPAARCYFTGTITAYVERYLDKNGIEDLRKARHFLDKLIEEEEKYAAPAAGHQGANVNVPFVVHYDVLRTGKPLCGGDVVKSGTVTSGSVSQSECGVDCPVCRSLLEAEHRS